MACLAHTSSTRAPWDFFHSPCAEALEEPGCKDGPETLPYRWGFRYPWCAWAHEDLVDSSSSSGRAHGEWKPGVSGDVEGVRGKRR